jgi:hypothetical protein
VLLQAALQPGRGATVAEQTRAFVLYGIAQLMLDNRGSARQAFRQALRLDAGLRIDSLYFFHEELEREFVAERLPDHLALRAPRRQGLQFVQEIFRQREIRLFRRCRHAALRLRL